MANEDYKSSLEKDNAELRSTVARQSQRVGQLEKKSPQDEGTARLQEIIAVQHEKIQYYQQEIEKSKQDMVRLEALLQRVQEESMRRELYQTPSVGFKNVSFTVKDGKWKLININSCNLLCSCYFMQAVDSGISSSKGKYP